MRELIALLIVLILVLDGERSSDVSVLESAKKNNIQVRKSLKVIQAFSGLIIMCEYV